MSLLIIESGGVYFVVSACHLNKALQLYTDILDLHGYLFERRLKEFDGKITDKTLPLYWKYGTKERAKFDVFQLGVNDYKTK